MDGAFRVDFLVGGIQHTPVCAADTSLPARARLVGPRRYLGAPDRASKRFVTVMSHFYLEQAQAQGVASAQVLGHTVTD